MNSTVSTSAAAEQVADEKREALTSSVERLQENLKPANLRIEAAEALEQRTPDRVFAAIGFVKSPTGLALLASVLAFVASSFWAQRRRSRSYLR